MNPQETALIVTENLFFVPRVENAAAGCGLQVEQVASEAAFQKEYGSRRVPLVLVDLEIERETWTGIVRSLVEEGEAGARIVAYGPHSEVALLEDARKAGCHAVLIKGEFDRRLTEVLETRGAGVTKQTVPGCSKQIPSARCIIESRP